MWMKTETSGQTTTTVVATEFATTTDQASVAEAAEPELLFPKQTPVATWTVWGGMDQKDSAPPELTASEVTMQIAIPRYK